MGCVARHNTNAEPGGFLFGKELISQREAIIYQ